MAAATRELLGCDLVMTVLYYTIFMAKDPNLFLEMMTNCKTIIYLSSPRANSGSLMYKAKNLSQCIIYSVLLSYCAIRNLFSRDTGNNRKPIPFSYYNMYMYMYNE